MIKNKSITLPSNIPYIILCVLVFSIMMILGMTKPALAEDKRVYLVPMYRLYNPNSGEHFYTSNIGERNDVLSKGWRDEKIGWYAPSDSTIPVYRLYNKNGGEHHYTTAKNEHDDLVNFYGWRDEGIGWYSDDDKTVPLYREYNPNQFANNHNYTTSLNEHNTLVGLGWNDEGHNCWHGLANSLATKKTVGIRFKNYNGSTLKTQVIEYGTNAKAPRNPSRTGYTFIGWDKSLNHITSDTVITAKWRINTYTVTFTDGCDKTLKTQTVEYNKNATPPATPSRDGYKFNGWDKPYNNIKTNTVINAQWKENKPPILDSNPPIDNHALQYFYELRALSTETYNTNEYYGTPCAMFYIMTNQPDYHNIFLYDGASYLQLDSLDKQTAHNSNYSKYGGVLTQYMDTSKPSFIDKSRLNGYIVNLPLKNNYALYELKNGKLSKIHDLNNASMVTIKNADTEKQNWFNRIRQEYMQNVTSMNLQNADSSTKFLLALCPILDDIMYNQSYVGYQYNNQHIENEGLELIKKGGKRSTGLWFFDHAPDWGLSQTYPRIGAELVKYVMGDEVEDAYGVCNGTTGYTETCNKPGYTPQTLHHGTTCVRFKDDPKTGAYYKKGFVISGDRDEELDSAKYNQLRGDTTNWIVNSNDRKCW